MPATPHRVRQNTSKGVDERIRRDILASVSHHRRHRDEIGARLRELDREWDIERAIEANAATLALAGVALSATSDRRWIVLPAAVSALLLQQAVQGWSPPAPVLRRMGFRTAYEIEEERHALLALRSGGSGVVGPARGGGPNGAGHDRGRQIPIGLLAAVAAGVVGAAVWRAVSTRRVDGPLISDPPTQSLRRYRDSEGRRVVGRSVTISRPREEVYACWRDFSQMPKFMENIQHVEVTDEKRSRWTIAAPAGREISFGTTITDERPGELIVWRSDDDAPIRNSGRIAFRDAPGGRGTEVEATIAYDPPGGEVGRIIAKLFQREPAIQARRDLKRFKQLMEAGEIATSSPRPAAPRA